MRLRMFLYGCAFIFIGGLVGSVQAQTQVSSCQRALPELIVTDKQNPTLNLLKSSQPHAFYQNETADGKNVYSQIYRSDMCQVKVSVEPQTVGRMSNNKIKRLIKAKTYFQITYQDSKKFDKKRFYYNLGSQSDQIDALMMTGTDSHIVQIRTTCYPLLSLSKDENENNVVKMSGAVGKAILPILKDCQ